MSASLDTGWEPVIGLEVHVELATATTLFCGCRNAFGAEPNTNVCPLCPGLPRSFPVRNQNAVDPPRPLGAALPPPGPPALGDSHRDGYVLASPCAADQADEWHTGS